MLIHKRISILIVGLALALALSPNSSSAAPSATAPASALNQKEIHSAYNEGDFDNVMALIDTFNKANKSYSRTDSIFIAKHLAVVYSANPQTREKGKYFMYRLLEMMPSAELVDMFVSDEIDRIFDKVRREFVTRQKSFGIDSTQISTPEKASTGAGGNTTQTASAKANAGGSNTASKGESKSLFRKNGFWIATGAGIVVAASAAVFIYFSDSPESGKTIPIGS